MCTLPVDWSKKWGGSVMDGVRYGLNKVFKTQFGLGRLGKYEADTANAVTMMTGAVAAFMTFVFSIVNMEPAIAVPLLLLPCAFVVWPFTLAAGAACAGFAAGVVGAPLNFIRGYQAYKNGGAAISAQPASAPAMQPHRSLTPHEITDATISHIKQLPENERQAVATTLKDRLTSEFGAAVKPDELTADISTQETKPKIRLKK